MDFRFVARAVLAIITLLAAALVSHHILFNQGPLAQGIDFGVFARASTDPNALIYRVHPAPFAYPPTALILMKPLTALGYWFWIAISALAFGLAAIVLAGRSALLAFASPAVVKCLVHGQVAMLLTGLQFIGLLVPPLLGGFLWGIAASVKPQLMLFAPLALIVRKDWRMLAGMVAGGSLMVAASLVFLEPSLWLSWVGAMANFNDIVQGGEMARTITPASAAVEAGLPSLPFIIGGLTLGTVAVISSARRVEGVQLVALITAASLVSSPYAHVYDAVGLIPACVVLMLTGRWVYAIPAALIFIGNPTATIFAMVFIMLYLSNVRSVPDQVPQETVVQS